MIWLDAMYLTIQEEMEYFAAYAENHTEAIDQDYLKIITCKNAINESIHGQEFYDLVR